LDPRQIAAVLAPLSPEERAALINQTLFGFDALVGMRFVSIAEDRLEATLAADERHIQPYGLVHGGVYAALVESACSVGAAMAVMAAGKNAVGLENTTRFKKGCRSGATLTVVAVPAGGAEGYPVWSASITDEGGEVCAEGRVTLRVLDTGKAIAGEAVGFAGDVVPDTVSDTVPDPE